jgi:hypothetical protein
MPTDLPSNSPENLTDDCRSELARRLYAALISKRLGVGMDYALKRYAPDASKNAYRLELAERIEREYVESLPETVTHPKSKAVSVVFPSQ